MAEEVARGLWAKMLMAQERAAVTRTIGEIMERKMRGAPIDAAELYHKVGGQSEFTYRLFAETFGSKDAGVKRGLISSNPETTTSMEKVTEALTTVARRLAEQKVTNAIGLATGVREINPNKVGEIFAGDYICVSVGIVAGGRVPWPDDPFIGGPTTWVFGASKAAR